MSPDRLLAILATGLVVVTEGACRHDSPPAGAPDAVVARSSHEVPAPAVAASGGDAGAPAATRSKVTLFDHAHDFAVASPPGAGHPKGTIAALSRAADCESGLVEIDLAALTELGHVCLGPSRKAMVASAEGGVVVAEQVDDALRVTWFDAAGATLTARSKGTLAGALSSVELYGLAVVRGRAVVVDDTAHALVVDDHARLVARHTCPGDIFHPGIAEVEVWGEVAVLTNLVHLGDDGTRPDKPVCAFGVDEAAATRKARLPDPNLAVFVDDGALYYGEPSGSARRLSADLRPSGPAGPLPARDAAGADATGSQSWRGGCPGVTGTAVKKARRVGGLWVVQTVSCCGDEAPSGLFVCEPVVAR